MHCLLGREIPWVRDKVRYWRQNGLSSEKAVLRRLGRVSMEAFLVTLRQGVGRRERVQCTLISPRALQAL